MKRAKPNRKAPTLEPAAKARDLTVTPAVGVGVKGSKLLEGAVKGKVYSRVEIHGT